MTDQPVAIDPNLSLLVQIVDATDIEVAITLSVSGGVISGLLVSMPSWLKKQTDLLRESELLAPLVELVERFKKDESTIRIGREIESASPDVFADEPTLPRFIHLSHACYIQGVQIFPASRDLHWRGRLTEISGWSFGSFDVLSLPK